jgi:hypothetical protein
MATKEELKRALKAFKKRLKLAIRDDESRLGGGGFSSGRKSGLVGIRPPDGFPPEIWKELEEKGRLKRIPGTKDQYELVRQQP